MKATPTSTQPLRWRSNPWRRPSITATLPVANGASTIVTVTTPNPPVINTVYRAGNEVAASTCNDANMLVAVGGTLVFAVSTVDTFNMTAYCYPT